MNSRRHRDGFSLTELLVVMAVIALLAAVSNPALHYALEQSRGTKCMAQLRQIYIGLQAYAGDNNQHLPVMLPMRATVNDTGPTLDTALTPYLSDPAVFHCPADNAIFAQSGCSYLWVYGYSVNAQGQQNSSNLAPSFPLLKDAPLSQIPFVSDKQSFHQTTPGTHVLYADGHLQ